MCKNNSNKNKFLKLLYFEAFLANFLGKKNKHSNFEDGSCFPWYFSHWSCFYNMYSSYEKLKQFNFLQKKCSWNCSVLESNLQKLQHRWQLEGTCYNPPSSFFGAFLPCMSRYASRSFGAETLIFCLIFFYPLLVKVHTIHNNSKKSIAQFWGQKEPKKRFLGSIKNDL